jgi:hypothetical protein
MVDLLDDRLKVSELVHGLFNFGQFPAGFLVCFEIYKRMILKGFVQHFLRNADANDADVHCFGHLVSRLKLDVFIYCAR